MYGDEDTSFGLPPTHPPAAGDAAAGASMTPDRCGEGLRNPYPDSALEVSRVAASKRMREVSCACSVATEGGRPVVVLGGGRVVAARDTEDGRSIGRRVEVGGTITAMAGVGGLVWVGCADGCVERLEVRDAEGMVPVGCDEGAHQTAVSFISEGSSGSVFTACRGGEVVEWVWSPREETYVTQQVVPPSASPLLAMVTSPTAVVLAAADGIRCVDIASGTAAVFTPHADAAVVTLALLFSTQLWSSADDGTLCVTSIPSTTHLFTTTLPSVAVAIALVGQKVWLWCADGELRLADPFTFAVSDPVERLDGAEASPLPPFDVLQVAQADLRRVWAPYPDGSVGVWDVKCEGTAWMYERVCEWVGAACTSNDASEKEREAAAAELAACRRSLQESEGLLETERATRGVVDDKVRELVTHSTSLKDMLVRREEENDMLRSDCEHLSDELQKAVAEVTTLAGRSRQLEESVEQLTGIEEEAVSLQMTVEDLLFRQLALSESSERAGRVAAAEASERALIVGCFYTALHALYREEARAHHDVNVALKQHIDSTRHS